MNDAERIRPDQLVAAASRPRMSPGRSAASSLEMVMEQVQGRLLQALMALPETILRRLAGRPIDLDGNRLAPEAQLLLNLLRITRYPVIDDLPVGKARRVLDQLSRSLALGQPIGAVRDLTIEGRPARVYTPSSRINCVSSPTLLHIHGGFHTFGGLKSHDGALRLLAESSGVQVIGLDYRLAPEHPFPAGLDDCVAAVKWLTSNPDAVGADPARIAVGGDSAGGNLAAAAVQALADELDLAFQLLVYPLTDFTTTSEARQTFSKGFFLTKFGLDQARERYLPNDADRSDARVDVAHGPISPNTPPTLVVTAGFDPLRDEGNAYAERLTTAGVSVELREYGDMIHGFFSQATVGQRARRYNQEIATMLGQALSD